MGHIVRERGCVVPRPPNLWCLIQRGSNDGATERTRPDIPRNAKVGNLDNFTLFVVEQYIVRLQIAVRHVLLSVQVLDGRHHLAKQTTRLSRGIC